MSEISAAKPATPSQIRSIHVAKAKAKLGDDEYRGLLEARYGKRSSKDLTRRQASDLLGGVFGRKLPNPPGRQRPRPKRERRARLPDNVVPLASKAQRALIAELAERVEWREPDGLARWLLAQGVAEVRTAKEADAAIEGLKAMCRRAGRFAG